VITDAYKNEDHLARAFGYLGLSYGIGLSRIHSIQFRFIFLSSPFITVSTLVGGFAANPAKQYPFLFGEVKLFIEHPFLLPCLISAGYILVVWITTLVKLPETIHYNNKPKKEVKQHLLPEEPVNETIDAPPDFEPFESLWTLATLFYFLIAVFHWWCIFAFMQVSISIHK
jgi:hypothetical protein